MFFINVYLTFLPFLNIKNWLRKINSRVVFLQNFSTTNVQQKTSSSASPGGLSINIQ